MTIERKEKKDPRPAPTSYSTLTKERVVGGKILSDERTGAFEEAKFKSQQTPGFNYQSVNLDRIKGRTVAAKILTQQKEDIRYKKL
jgi:hypothetical protein